MRICIYEDNSIAQLEPLTQTRPVFDLRCGATTLHEKYLRSFPDADVEVIVRPILAQPYAAEHPAARVNDLAWLETGDDPVVFINGRWVPLGGQVPFAGPPEVGTVGEEVAFVVVSADEVRGLTLETLSWQLAEWSEELPRRSAGGRMLRYPWDLIEHNAEALADDFRSLNERPGRVPSEVTLVGPTDQLWIHPAARVEPLVLIDTTKGPVMILEEAIVQGFSRLEGPCCVGPRTQVLGARVRGSSFGPQCRIGGEVESSIVYGHSNKAHDGFLGHSYLGEWVNFGAGTHTSDLRTDYGTVRFRINGQSVDSAHMKVGAFIGDHTKTSISALLNTGTMVGPFGLLLASGALLPRVVPAFCQVTHGQIEERRDLRLLFTTAATMMARRDREWTGAHSELYLSLYEATAEQRQRLLTESEQRRLRRAVGSS
jgi:UDP-N-acetylglucosamine diphosphorylase/glucosamine-1-phosphate N-acetyltransferase